MVEILQAEFEDALAESSADWKKSGRILKIILFGSYARGDWVDEPLTTKGYRSDFDLLVVVNNNKLADFAYWYKAKDRLDRDRAIKTPTSFIVHSRRFVNTALRLAHRGRVGAWNRSAVRPLATLGARQSTSCSGPKAGFQLSEPNVTP